MVGLGEEWDEVVATLRDLRAVGCQIVTIGQYLRPSLANLPMSRYYTPAEFAELKRVGLELGFGHVESGPLVRSSYHAHEQTQAYESRQSATSKVSRPSPSATAFRLLLDPCHSRGAGYRLELATTSPAATAAIACGPTASASPTEKQAAHRAETYWGQPVPGFGDPQARVLVLGLAPAAHGANRTGRVFTGDGPGGSGDFLMRAMHAPAFASIPTVAADRRWPDTGRRVHRSSRALCAAGQQADTR